MGKQLDNLGCGSSTDVMLPLTEKGVGASSLSSLSAKLMTRERENENPKEKRTREKQGHSAQTPACTNMESGLNKRQINGK